jgi:peptidoglycan hydrolase-like protein with peptidoglycan-binding domain
MNHKLGVVGLNVCLLLANLMTIGYTALSSPHFTNTSVVQAAETMQNGIPLFDPNFVLSDETFRSTRAFPTAESVQKTLESYNSPLKSASFEGKRVSQWIFGAARGTTSQRFGVVPDLNPGVILAYLEKEQSLLSLSQYDVTADPEKRIQNAMGYGCPDTAPCNPQYSGFVNQVNYGAYQLEYNFRLATVKDDTNPYQLNKTITTLDAYSVLLSNAATAAQYHYTPHVYWGNYNLWKIVTANGWGRSEQTYPMATIDAINLPGKRVPGADNTPISTITVAQVASILQRTIVDGEQSADIDLLQRFLRQEGFFIYPYITGYFGTVTKAALSAYRTAHQPIAPVVSPPVDRCEALKNQQWALSQQDADVKALQDCMTAKGYFSYSGGSTGYFGPVTQAALAAWRAPTVPVPVSSPSVPEENQCEILSNKSWRLGQTGNDVRALQQCLSDAGVYQYPGGITGYFGNYTQGVLKNKINPSDNCATLKSQARSWNIGDASDQVRTLQQCLKDEGVYRWPSGVTGYFGPYTKGLLG